MRTRMNGKLWEEMSEEEHRRYPNDVEAHGQPGRRSPRTRRSTCVTSDKGIVMLRRLLQAQLQAVAEGRDPAGVSFDPEAPPVVFTAGNWWRNDRTPIKRQRRSDHTPSAIGYGLI